MSYHIRPFTAADYAPIAAAGNAAYTDAQGQIAAPFSAERMQRDDAERDPICRFARWVAEADGQVVGMAEHDQTSHRYNPHRFWVEVNVHPAYQRRGIGSALYEQVISAIQAFDPRLGRGQTREDFTHSVAFLLHRGWYEAKRLWESDLDLRDFDPARFGDRETPLRAQGITLHTFADLAADPDRDRKLYDLVWEIRQDLPDLDPPTQEPFEVFVQRRLYHPDVIPESFFIAVHNGQYVGQHYFRLAPETPGAVNIAQLGVARAYRGRGVAWALKLRGLAWALAQGYQSVRTANESQNTPVLRINEQLGFRRRPAWIDFLKAFGADAPASAAPPQPEA